MQCIRGSHIDKQLLKIYPPVPPTQEFKDFTQRISKRRQSLSNDEVDFITDELLRRHSKRREELPDVFAAALKNERPRILVQTCAEKKIVLPTGIIAFRNAGNPSTRTGAKSISACLAGQNYMLLMGHSDCSAVNNAVGYQPGDEELISRFMNKHFSHVSLSGLKGNEACILNTVVQAREQEKKLGNIAVFPIFYSLDTSKIINLSGDRIPSEVKEIMEIANRYYSRIKAPSDAQAISPYMAVLERADIPTNFNFAFGTGPNEHHTFTLGAGVWPGRAYAGGIKLVAEHCNYGYLALRSHDINDLKIWSDGLRQIIKDENIVIRGFFSHNGTETPVKL